jgi:hypothetical protein
VTRKLPADVPSPEERGAVRPDEPEQGVTVTVAGVTTTIGYLGVEINGDMHPKQMEALRLAEIERRILAIEAKIQ